MNWNTADLQALDAAHHIHPFTDSAALNQRGARVITRAKGVWLTDSEGREILDAMAGLWCVNIGYGREELARVAAAQIQDLSYYNTFFNTTHPPAVELSARLAQLAPDDLNHVFFAGSGSEANDTNLRMVRHYWSALKQPKKKIVIARHNAYHGSTMAGASLGGMKAMHAQGGLPIPDIAHIEQPYYWALGDGLSEAEFGQKTAEALEKKILELGAENVAAFIAEPVQGAGGVIIPPQNYWPVINEICKKHNILLIADEVICGFGRTGNWFGSQTYGIEPDIMTTAKGLSSGYLPIAASIVNDRVYEGLVQGGEFNHGYTYSAHPVAAAVASENLRIIEEEGLVDKVASDTGPHLAEQWLALGDHPLVGEARIVGMMGALELSAEQGARVPFKNAKEGDVGLICREHAFDNNLVMRHVGDKMIISPPLVISHAEVDELITRARATLDQTYDALQKAGMR